MRAFIFTLGVLTVLGAALPAAAQQIPSTPDEVARPGGQLPGDPRIALVKVADGFNDPVNVTSAGDGSGRIFVVERIGRVRVVHADGTVQEEPFLDLTRINPFGTDVQTGFVEQGLYAIAFDPDFAEKGHVYVHYASLRFNGDGLILRFTMDRENPDFLTPERAGATAKLIMGIGQPWYNHNGGQIAFGPDGYLYIATGDGGYLDGLPGHGQGDPLRMAQNLSTLLGKLLRVDVSVKDRPYRVPEDNPFQEPADERPTMVFGVTEKPFAEVKAGTLPEIRWLGRMRRVDIDVEEGAYDDPAAPSADERRVVFFGATTEDLDRLSPRGRPEIWAYGLRNPYMFHFDPETGDLFIADVGHSFREEINWQPADSPGGENYGWPLMEGSRCHAVAADADDCLVVGVLPAAEYPHIIPAPGASPLEDGWGCSAQGLGVANYGGMRGVYVVGDWCSGRVFGVGWDDDAGRWQMQELLQTDLSFTAGGYDEDGYVLAVNCNCFYRTDQGPLANPPGSLWRIMPEDEVPEGAEVARTVRR